MKSLKLGKNLIIIFVAVILITAVSGCGKNPETPAPVATTATDANQTTTLEQTATDDTQNAQTTTTAEEVDADGWKTYRNEKLGLSFKYPGKWILNDCSSKYNDGLSLKFNYVISEFEHDCNLGGYDNKNSLIFIGIVKNKIMENNLQVEEKAISLSFIKSYKVFTDNKYLITEKSNYVRGGEGEILSPISKRKYFTTYIPFNQDNSITIFYNRVFESEDPNFKYMPNYYDIYEKIISSFNLFDLSENADIDNIDVNKWKTFISKEYGFKIKYPPNARTMIGPDKNEDGYMEVYILSETKDLYAPIVISIYNNPKRLSASDWWNERYSSNNYNDGHKITKINRAIDGFVIEDDFTCDYIFSKNDKIYKSDWIDSDNNVERQKKITKKILNTFEFIDE